MAKPIVDVSNAGVVPRGDYADILKRIVAEGHCPFCREHLLKHHTKPILVENKHWLVTENFRPYSGVERQFLVISSPHVERIEDLPVGAGDEMVRQFRFLSNKFGFDGASVLWRSGNTAMTGASVAHLHFQVIVGVPRSESTAPINALVGFKPG